MSVTAAPTPILERTYGALAGLPAVANALSFGQSTADLSDGVVTSRTFVRAHVVSCPTTIDGLRLVFQNWYTPSLNETDGLNAITVGASLEIPSGVGGSTFVKATFAGADTVSIPAGEIVMSDPIERRATTGTEIDALIVGQVFRTRTWVQVASSAKFPLGVPKMVGNIGGGAAPELGGEGQVDSDLRTTASGWTYNTGFGYGPSAILGSYTGLQRVPSIAVVGDSLANGYEDSVGVYKGFIARALSGKFGWINVGTDGERAEYFLNTSASGGKAMWRRLRQIDGCTHAILCIGRNDLTAGTAAATIEGYLTRIANALTVRGKRVYLCTIPPSATSTDGFATVNNQTTAADNPARITLNAWIRTTPAPCKGFIELADAVESARDSGKWKAGYTTAGIHPNATGSAAAAAAVPTVWQF